MTHSNPDEVNLCKGCYTMKHTNDKGLCGRCTHSKQSEPDNLLNKFSSQQASFNAKTWLPNQKKQAEREWLAIQSEARSDVKAYAQQEVNKVLDRVRTEVIGKDDTNRWGGTLDITTRQVNRNALRKEQRKVLSAIESYMKGDLSEDT